ncbi:MAG: type II/IV secretion system protein [Candidatus Kerfeldbacteria bacterium]|nr:type II/IV secretion system protein [Candidatus Kerfeldbacteria bacterium]
MLDRHHVADIVQHGKLLPVKELADAVKKADEQHTTLENLLLSENTVTEQTLYEAAAAYYGVPFLNLNDVTVRKDLLGLLPESIMQSQNVVIYDQTERTVKVATLDPDDLQTLDFIRKKTGLELDVTLTTPSALKNVLKQLHKGLRASMKDITKDDRAPDAAEPENLKALAEDVPVIRIVDTLLEYAIFEGASDIHIEPQEQDIIVRFRIDGVLREVMRFPKKVHSGLIARIKILANLKIDEHRLPQDGRFHVTTDDYKVAFRVSILPVYDGEKVVLRLLNESARVLTLEQLGMLPGPLQILQRQIRKPHGMILVTGPTGSGKTTTLYTIMSILNTSDVNISTIEDPIEYRMPHINQSQVSPRIGFTFAGGLRALLRQDPNIIMVGEIRDRETAEISSHAAMTGHLVLTTLHTNDAAGTLPRLLEMGVPTFLIASTTNCVMAQRLVRKICPHCITSYNLSKKQIAQLERTLNLTDLLATLEREGAIHSAKASMESLLFYRGKGCKKCNDSGYRGRIGIYEILEVNEEVSKLILDNATGQQVYEAAKRQHMITMLEDGFIKAKYGITSIEEVLRVTQE